MGSSYKIAIIGLGSIGRRHLLNIVNFLEEESSSYTIDLVRSGKGKELDAVTAKYVHCVYNSYDSVPDDYDILFVTNPTHLHFDTIKYFVSKTKHMFIEKPIFDRTDNLLESIQFNNNSVYYVACPLRYTDVIQYLKNKCNLGDIYCARVICSSYLPDWRQSQDYRNTYSAHKEQGGGVSIDLIHEWDYLMYLFGRPQQILNIRGKFSNLEIDSDDLSLYLAKYSNMAVEVHLDYFGRKELREIQIFTEEDTIVGDLIKSEIRYLKSGKVNSFNQKRNDYQKKEIAHFFDIIRGRIANDNDIKTAFRTLQIAKEGR